ncbi:3-oxo-5-alpha-steroid 4-dehydrogenase [Perilla frutescens var. frutescens]|nr:3-oxo-5-alpha-steroid 4-dehydrogenase [Perilla frutescens var. frutescens]
MASSSNHSLTKNLRGALLAFLAPLPSIFFYLSFLRHYAAAGSPDSLSPVWAWCYHHPILLANLLFFLNINVLFWALALLQSSNWLIDLYWTVIPVLLLHYYKNHPAAESGGWRSRCVVVLTWIWFVRMTHNYFRREKWQWGEREDWRINDMRRQYGQSFWWVSFFTVYVAQQVFLMAICMPLYVIHWNEKAMNIWDVVAAVVCLSGVTTAYLADTQLYNFGRRNERLKKGGQVVVPVLEEGLWRYSRHPNYFGEQLWWSGMAMFAWNLNCTWCFMGPLLNALCLGIVTLLVEERISKQDHRAQAYTNYKNTTSLWIPWFKNLPHKHN